MSSSIVFADPPTPTTHSCLDLFTTGEILVDIQRGYDEPVYPPTQSDAPVLEFEFTGPKTEVTGTFIDTKNIFLELEVQLVPTMPAAKPENKPVFVNNLAHSLFQNVEVFLNGTSVSSANNLHPYKSIMETDLSFAPHAKEGVMVCRGYEFEDDPTNFDDDSFTRRKLQAASDKSWYYYTRLCDSFLTDIDTWILPGIDVRLRLTRSVAPFVLIHDDLAVSGNYGLKIASARLNVRMIELRSDSFVSIERGLSKKAAQYDFRETLPKSFLIASGTSVYCRDDIFNRAPISRLVVAMVPESSFTGSYTTNPFHFSKHDLGSVRITREGAAVGCTPLSVEHSDIRAYFCTMEALGFEHDGNGITIDNFNAHYCLVFKLTADLHLNDGTIRPELTGGRLALELKFQKPVTEPIRLLLLGERRSLVVIDKNREVVKNSTIYNG